MTCPISPRYSEFRETLHPCLPPYGFGNEDKTPYSMPRWQQIPANQTVLLSEFALRKMCPKPWRYHSAEELQTLPFQVRVFRLVPFCFRPATASLRNLRLQHSSFLPGIFFRMMPTKSIIHFTEIELSMLRPVKCFVCCCFF